MPELPEVEVVKRSLKRKIQNLVIKNVKINDGNLRYKVNKVEISKLAGKRILKIKRRSKFLIFQLEKQINMMVHLGMTGKFFFVDGRNIESKTSYYYKLDEKNQKHNRIIFFFRNKQKLIYNDVRKFGFLKFFEKKEYNKNLHFKNLGPEPLKQDFNFKYLKRYISGRNRNIKDILMDQKCISGLGNIYVNEILFLSGIMPIRQVDKLSDLEIKNIVKNTKKVLKNAIKLGGSSIKNFSSGDGKEGNFQRHFKVYGRIGEKCSNVDCNETVLRTKISNRASFFCKSCQK